MEHEREMNEAGKQIKAPLRVLHLEDNSLDAELIKDALEYKHVPCSITLVSTEKDFEAALGRGDFDVILSDSQLPGYETMKALARSREACPAVPFIFLSGSSSPTIKANALSRGARDFIQKDEMPKLVSLLNQLLEENKAPKKTSLPETEVPVVVQCKDFRCLGFLDQNGKWRDFVSSEELLEVTDWFDL